MELNMNYIEKRLPEAPVNYKDGSQAVNLDLIITVFFKGGYTTEVRHNMVACVDRYYAECKSHIKILTPKWVSITDKDYPKNRQEYLNLTEQETDSWYMAADYARV